MVSILYHRQREERERRLERLSSARKAGALLSIISARSYCQQKKEQERLTSCEQRKQWKAAQETKLKEIAEAINNAERNRMTAHKMAEVHRCNLHDMAKREKSAWVGEKNLESARYALAVKTMEHDNNLRNASKRESRMYRMKSALIEQTRLQKLKADHHPPSTIENVKSQFKQSGNIASSQNNLTRVHFVKNDKLLQPFNTECNEKCYVNYFNTPYGSNRLLSQQRNELEEGDMNEMRESSVNNNNNDSNNDDGVHTMMHVTPYSCKRRPVIDANSANSLHEANQGKTLNKTNNMREEKRSSNVKFHRTEIEKGLLNTLCEKSKLHEWHVITNGEPTKRENLQKRRTGLFDRNFFSVQSESEERRNQEGVIEENAYPQKLLDEQRSKNSSLPTETDSYKNLTKIYNWEGYEHEQESFSNPLAREHIKLYNNRRESSIEPKEATINNRAKQIEKSTVDMEEDKSDSVDLKRDALEREHAAVKAFREEFLLTHLTSSGMKRHLHKNCNDQTDYSSDIESNSIIYLPIQTILSSAQMNDNLTADKEQANESEMTSFTVQQVDFSSHDVEILDEKLNSSLHDNNYTCDVHDSSVRNKHDKHTSEIEEIRECYSNKEVNKSQHCSIADNCNDKNILRNNKSYCLRNDTIDKNKLHVELKSSTGELTHLACERNGEERMTDKREQHDEHANNNSNNNNDNDNKLFTVTESNNEIEVHIAYDSNHIMTYVNEHNICDVINNDSTSLEHKKCEQKTECNVKEDEKMENVIMIEDVLTEKLIPSAIESESTNDNELHKSKLNAPTAGKNNLCEKEMINADNNNPLLLPTASAKLAPTLSSLMSSSSTATETSVISKSSESSSSSSTVPSEAVTTSTTSTFLSSPATPYSEKMSNTPSSSSSSFSSHCSSSLTESSTLQSTSTSTNLLASTSSDGQTMTAKQLRDALTQLRQKLLHHIKCK